jgi:hypothetical protein
MKVGNHPVFFSELNGSSHKGEEFTTPQSTANQKSKDGVIAFAPKAIASGVQQQRPARIGSEPIAQSDTDSTYAFDSPGAGSKFRTEQAGICCLVRHAPYRGHAEVNRRWSELLLLQVDSISENNGAIASKSRLGAVPIDELVYRMVIRSLTALRSQAVQYGRLRLFEIR